MSSVAPEPIRTDQDLRRLQSAARELGIETWRILQTFPTLSPSSNGTSSSQNEFTVRELLKYQSSAKRLGLPFWKVLQSLTPEGSEADTPSSLRPIADNGLSAEGSPISLDHSSHQNDSGGAEQYVNGASLSADFLGENVLRLSGEVEQAGQTEQAGQIEEGEDPFGQKILGHRKLLLICLELSGFANDNFSSTLGQAPLNTLVSQPWFNPDVSGETAFSSSRHLNDRGRLKVRKMQLPPNGTRIFSLIVGCAVCYYSEFQAKQPAPVLSQIFRSAQIQLLVRPIKLQNKATGSQQEAITGMSSTPMS